MIYRYMYAAYAAQNAVYKDIAGEKVNNLTLCRYRDILFLYFETKTEKLPPEEVIGGETRPFPDGKRWFYMPDIFHFSAPQSEEHWLRTEKDSRPWPRLNRVRREKLGSYIFYHQQMQEEYLGKLDNKFGIIGLFDEYLFYYMETPETVDTADYKGKLQTKNTPLVEWDDLMTTHFNHWDDVSEEWRELDILLFRPLH